MSIVRIILLLLLASIGEELVGSAEQTKCLQVGDVPPPLEFGEVLQGPDVSRINWDELTNRVVVLEFWTIGCAPCRQAIPHWNSLVEHFTGKSVVFISISSDSAVLIRNFLQKNPINGWVTVDGKFDATLTAYGLTGWPFTFVIGRSGRILAVTHPALLETNHLEDALLGRPLNLPVPKLSDMVSRESRDVIPEPTNVLVNFSGPLPKPTHRGWNFKGWSRSTSFPDFHAKLAYLPDAFAEFFHVSPKLVYGSDLLPKGLYNISAIAPSNQINGLNREFAAQLEKVFQLSAHVEPRAEEVYVLTVISTNAPGRKFTDVIGGGSIDVDGFKFKGMEMSAFSRALEGYLDRTVLNESGLQGRWEMDVTWPVSNWKLKLRELGLSVSPDPEVVIKALREQLGFELLHTKRTVPVLKIVPVAE
jgi:uncharacterized protein (TIGR03435 family)